MNEHMPLVILQIMYGNSAIFQLCYSYSAERFVFQRNCCHMSDYKNASYMAFLSYVPQNLFYDFEKYP